MTKYLLQDGTYTDDVSEKDGVLRSKNGLAVATRSDGTPQTLESEAEANKNVLAAQVGPSTIAAPDPVPGTPRPVPTTPTPTTTNPTPGNPARPTNPATPAAPTPNPAPTPTPAPAPSH